MSVVLNATTKEVTQTGSKMNQLQVAGTTETLSTPNGTAAQSTTQYFECAVILIGCVGTLANGTVLVALLLSRQLKKQLMKVPLLNQLVLDLCSCILLVIIYSVKVCNFYLVGSWGYWLCMLLTSEMFLWCVLNASIINLVVITMERYIKIVHSVWHKNHFRPWMIYLACVFSWFFGIVMEVVANVFTTAVVDGVCMAYVIWQSETDKRAYGIWYFISFFIVYFHLRLCSHSGCHSPPESNSSRSSELGSEHGEFCEESDEHHKDHDHRHSVLCRLLVSYS
jgi:hypothetical protein